MKTRKQRKRNQFALLTEAIKEEDGCVEQVKNGEDDEKLIEEVLDESRLRQN